MNQFKDVFLGHEKRSYTRAVSIQKCMRAGGKHNDLDNVGFTKRHLTFFEMMGNFSFGDYFKKEAIEFAWEFLTREMKLPAERMHATVFKTDDDAYDLWREISGLPESRIHRHGEKDNFWQMGDLGPCGPCSEIFIDRGPETGCKDATCDPSCDCDRFLEIWNLVFMQFDRQPDGTLKELAHKGVDTGMGFERLLATLQGKDSVFEIDIFTQIIRGIEGLTGCSYDDKPANIKAAFHVLADHARAATFLIVDGCMPSNEGRGYVLRKLIRRAALFEQKISDKSIFAQLAGVVTEQMGEFYPELRENIALVTDVLAGEVKKFSSNLLRGQQLLDQVLQEAKESKLITGQQAFTLYDTYGFPVELVIASAREQGYRVDEKGFDKEMRKQKERSGKKGDDPLDHVELPAGVTSEFTGYDELETASTIAAIVCSEESVKIAAAGASCWLITHKSPFHVIGGGQVPDEGWLVIAKHRVPVTTARLISGCIAVKVKLPVDIKIGDSLTSIVDEQKRRALERNHTATHLLQAALMKELGSQVKQAGSMVDPDRLRFDFAYPGSLDTAQLDSIEELVNEWILQDIPLTVEYMSMKEAEARGAIAFFGDKYNPDEVRVISIGDVSIELCGGTHVRSTGKIGSFKITEIASPSAGHRRVEAVAGEGAFALFRESFAVIKQLGQEFKVPRAEVADAVTKQRGELRECREQMGQLRRSWWQESVDRWLENVVPAGGIPFLYLTLDGFASDDLREIANELLQRKPAFYFLGSRTDERFIFYVALAPDLASSVNLKEFAAWLRAQHDLRGGGSAIVLQGGGVYKSELEAAIREWLSR